MARTVTASTVLDRIRLYADSANGTSNVTDAEVYSMIDASARELREMLQMADIRNIQANATFPTVAGVDTYILSSSISVQQVDVRFDSSDDWQNANRISFREVNAVAKSSARSWLSNEWIADFNSSVSYTTFNSSSTDGASADYIRFFPTPQGSHQWRVWYMPDITIDGASDQIDGVNGWEGFIVHDVAALILAREESDPSYHLMMKQRYVDRINKMAETRDLSENKTIIDFSNDTPFYIRAYRKR